MDEAKGPDQGTLLAPAQPSPAATQGKPGAVLDVGLLVVFALVLAFVAITNLWLRRRAEREGGGD